MKPFGRQREPTTPGDPVARALEEAPYDDEPLTAERLADLDAAERDRQEGRFVSHDEARRQLFQALAAARR